MTDKLRLAVLTQDDSFVIPYNIKLLTLIEGVEVVAIVKIDSEGSLMSKRGLFLQGFGLCQMIKLGGVLVKNKVLDAIDWCFSYRLAWFKSLKSAAVVCGADYRCTNNPNSVEDIDWLSHRKVDLIVSYSAPCIFKKSLLSLPNLGCINLHCSLLPKFAGLLPSFWALYENSEILGATVHRMDSKIDNGPILGQVTLPILTNPSMFTTIKCTKQSGGHLMVSVVKDIMDGSQSEKPNFVENHNYYSWPTVDQIKAFRRDGGRLI